MRDGFFQSVSKPRCPTTSYNLYDLLISPNHCRFISHGTSQKRFPELVQVHPLSASPTKWVRKKRTEARPCFSFSASKQYIAFSCVFLTISFAQRGTGFGVVVTQLVVDHCRYATIDAGAESGPPQCPDLLEKYWSNVSESILLASCPEGIRVYISKMAF
jgi:hypothetical protein